MRNEDFESIIRRKLESLQLTVSPTDWEGFLSRMQTAFDSLIREKLNTLSFSPQSGDWTAMLELLDRVVEEVIQQKLDTLRPEQQGGDWGLMSSQLNENPFDLAIATKLDQVDLNSPESDWTQFAAQLDESPLDTAIAQSMASLELDFVPADWERMVEVLAHSFDASIRQALAGYELPLSAEDWPQLARQLDERPFDGQIREKLLESELPYQAQDWALMMAVLELPFDEKVQEKLGNHTTPFQSEDWRLMADRLDQVVIPEARTSLAVWYQNWRNYSSAAAAVLLLIFAMLGGKDSFHFRPEAGKFVSLENNSPVILPQLRTSPLEAPMLVVNPAFKEEAETLILKHTETTETDLRIAEAQSDPRNTSAQMVSSIQPIGATMPVSGQIASQLLQQGTANSLVTGEGKIPHDQDPGSMAVLYEQMDLSDIRRVGPMSFGDVLQRENAFATQAPASNFTPLEWIPAFAIGLYASNARTWAELTGNDPMSGYTYGLRLEMKLTQQLSVVSGLNYSEKRFRHIYPVWGDNRQYTQNELDGQLFLIEAPLMLRYEMTKADDAKARFYLQAGILAQISTQENYWHYNSNNPANRSLENQTQLRVLSPEKLERGYNTYIGNLQTGLGVEYPITDRLSAQLEPYLLLGLQPTKGAGAAGLNKRLSTLGVGFGLVYDLKKD